MDKGIVVTELAPAAVGAYSQGVELGKVFYFSGQIGIAPGTGRMEEGFEGQLARVMKNIDGLLSSQGLSRGDVVKTTVFLTDLKRFPSVNEAYEGYFSKPYPARSCIEVSGLPKGALVEIEVVAARTSSC